MIEKVVCKFNSASRCVKKMQTTFLIGFKPRRSIGLS